MGMDGERASEVGSKQIKSQSQKKSNGEHIDENSSDDEVEQSFMQKIGGLFFFGCGNKESAKKSSGGKGEGD